MHGVRALFHAEAPKALVQVEFNLALEEEMLAVVAHNLREGDAFMDVGSNVGVFAVVSGRVVGQRGTVIAFEPDPRSFAQLQKNLSLNDLQTAQAFMVALGEHDEKARLYVDRPAPSLIGGEGNSEGQGNYEWVQVVNGDRFLKMHGLPVPRVIKIDAEGYEYGVLRGLSATLSDAAAELVACEVHPYLLPKHTTVKAIVGLLKSFGFDEITTLPRRGEVQVIARKAGSAGRPTHAFAHK